MNNARLDYVVTDLSTSITKTVTTHPINSRYHFGGGFIGDYADIAVGSDDFFSCVVDRHQQHSDGRLVHGLPSRRVRVAGRRNHILLVHRGRRELEAIPRPL